jgi:hypothetical protein
MSTSSDYSADEWKAISAAPAAAAMAITISGADDPFKMASDAFIVRAIMHSSFAGAPEIVSLLVEIVSRRTCRLERPEIYPGGHARTKRALIGTVKTAVRAIQRKSPGEVEVFKPWLALIATRVSQATNPAARGMHFSREKQNTIDRLAGVLAVAFASRDRPQTKNPGPRYGRSTPVRLPSRFLMSTGHGRGRYSKTA